MKAFRVLGYVWLLLVLAPIPAWAGMARIYVTNSAGDSIHVIDPTTNKVVQQIKGVEGAHGGKIMHIMLTQTRLNENSVLVRRLLNKIHQ